MLPVKLYCLGWICFSFFFWEMKRCEEQVMRLIVSDKLADNNTEPAEPCTTLIT